MATEFTFIRHAHTAANEKRLFCGATDTPLSKTGKEQLKTLEDSLNDKKYDVLLSGTTRRVKDTALAAADALSVCKSQIIFDERIREINFGSFEGKSAAELEDIPEWKEYMENWLNFTFPEGDSVKGYFEQCGKYIRDIKTLYEGKSVLIFASKGFISCCLCALKGLGAEHMFDFVCDNCVPVDFKAF